MKLIKQVKLFYKEGTSDKVYEIDLCEISSERFAVNFRYGRRGNNLKEGTKTPEFLTFQKAQAIFDTLEMEKRNKGYQTEIQTFVELPTLNLNEQDPKKKAILTRLEDAVLDRKSVFKTHWKTSRVIWKAAQLNIKEAEAFILKLATKGDKLQLYSSIYAFRLLKTTRSIDLLQSLTMNKKQPLFIRNLALLTILDLADELTQNHTINYIVSILPPEVKYFLNQQNQTDLMRFYQDKIVSNEKLEGLSILYIIQDKFSFVKDFLLSFVKEIPFQAPFFQEIRAIYKLAAFRHDAKMQTLMAYLFEKHDSFYYRTASLDPEAYHVSQYVSAIDQYIDLRKEYKKDDCRIAFSQFTKYYFQNHAVNHLNQLGLSHESKMYLSFAINALLHYDESDYTPAYAKLMTDYGEMNWTDRQYYFTKIHFPECSKLYLLTVILFGNDKNRQLSPKLEFYTHKSFYKSEGYIFNEAYATEVKEIPKVSYIVKKEPFGSGIINLFKNIFSKPKPIEAPIIEEVPVLIETPMVERLELFPKHWDQQPEAYIQLIIKAKLNIIVSFAYKNLKNHPAFDNLIKKLDKETILKSFYSPFTDAQKFAFDGLKQHETLFSSDPIFVVKILNTKLKEGLD